MNTATHTPTPWAEQEMPRGSNDVGYNDRITDTDGEGTTICEFPYGLNADSAFIVRACNAHDELVAALNEYMSQFGQALEAHGISFTDSQRAADAKARAALAKVNA